MSASRMLAWSICGLCAAHGTRAQEPVPPNVVGVEYRGAPADSETLVAGIARIEMGKPLPEGEPDAAVARLLRTGRFWSVTARTEPRPGGVLVVFEMRARPTITEIRFEGNDKVGERKLRSFVPLKAGDLVDRFAVREGAAAITDHYHSLGYTEATVSTEDALLEQQGVLLYRIDEGARTRVTEITFLGSETFPRRELMKQIESRTSFWIFRSGAFDADRVESDARRLERYHRDEGFLDARVTHRVEPTEKPGDLRLLFEVHEGTRYRVERLLFTGQSAFAESDFRPLMQTTEGVFVRARLLEADANAIRGLYGENGYIYATVTPSRLFSDTPGWVVVTLDVREGDQYRVGRVVVRGNTRTKDKVVRRELNLYPPDDLWNTKSARDAEQSLRESRYFDAAQVYPVGDEPGVRDVVMDVREAERAGNFIFGVGVTSNSGLVGSVVLDLQNFDLNDVPRSFSEFFKFRSFYGAGQRVRIELEPGTDVNRLRLDFTEPYLFDRPLRGDVSTYLFTRGRDGYDEERIGTTLSLGRRFPRGPLAGWAGEVALRLEAIEVSDIDLLAARAIREDKGSSILTSLKVSLAIDRTDSRFLPTRGDRFRASYEQAGVLGGDHDFGRALTSYTWYTALGRDELDRPTVLQLHGELGAVFGDAPVFERFYAGGIGSIRGFQFRGVGPRQGLEDNNVGGDTLVLGGAEYSFPLYGESVRGHFFLDAGTVDSGLRATLGTGIRLTIDLLGPVPLEFNVGVPVVTRDDDEEQVFSFFIGTAFY